MVRYFIQYPAGTGELILDALADQIGNVDVHYQDDSALVFDSTASESQVGAISFVKNAFVVLTGTPRGSIDKGVEQLGRVVGKVQIPRQSPKLNKFRTMIHVDGELSSVNPKSKVALERAIASRTGARLEPRGMCQEYWVVGRLDMRELLLCMRLPKPKRPPKARGAISYELSAMLIHASRPVAREIFLDPFGGSGSLVQARLEMPAREIWYSDRDLREFRPQFPREMVSDKRVRLLADDAMTLSSIPDGKIDVIVTDPPWGEHEDLEGPYPDFAQAMGKSFDRVLHPLHGRFVILCSRRTSDTIAKSMEGASFTVRSSHSILVNGHPATVLIGDRDSR